MRSTEVNTQRPIYFIGIGGIGMSALARYFIHYGYVVGGYDRVETPNTEALAADGAMIIYEDDADLIPDVFKNPECMVIYTPAIPEDNHIRQYFVSHDITLHKRSEALGIITGHFKALCVAGTHGKTTTSTLLTHLMTSSSYGANAFLGGISLNHQTNLVLDEKSDYVVVEADEYDRSFHRLKPYYAIITSTTPDHLDIYGDAETFRDAFEHFSSLVHPEGAIFVHEEAILTPRLRGQAKAYSYGKSTSCDYHYDRMTYRDGHLYFDWYYPGGCYRDLLIGTPIEINVINATAALAVAQACGCTEQELRDGLATFKGVHRRFERVLTDPHHPLLIDDYAHHPEEIEASLRSINKLYPNRHITVVFQPHLYSRTADFKAEFGAALSHCDDIILLDIYPAREKPIPGITSDSITPYITASHCTRCHRDELIAELKKHDSDVVIMMGAGDIEFLVKPVAELLKTIDKR